MAFSKLSMPEMMALCALSACVEKAYSAADLLGTYCGESTTAALGHTEYRLTLLQGGRYSYSVQPSKPGLARSEQTGRFSTYTYGDSIHRVELVSIQLGLDPLNRSDFPAQVVSGFGGPEIILEDHLNRFFWMKRCSGN